MVYNVISGKDKFESARLLASRVWSEILSACSQCQASACVLVVKKDQPVYCLSCLPCYLCSDTSVGTNHASILVCERCRNSGSHLLCTRTLTEEPLVFFCVECWKYEPFFGKSFIPFIVCPSSSADVACTTPDKNMRFDLLKGKFAADTSALVDVYGWDKLPQLDSQQLDNAISLASALAMNGVSKRRNNDMYIFFGC